MKKFNEIEQKFNSAQQEQKDKIRSEPNKFKRFWKWVWYLTSFPFKWIFINIRDWRTALIFIIVFLVVSSEVWVPYLIGLICWGTDLSKWMFGIGSAGLFFWNCVPGTPFLIICIGLTIAVKGIFNKIKKRS